MTYDITAATAVAEAEGCDCSAGAACEAWREETGFYDRPGSAPTVQETAAAIASGLAAVFGLDEDGDLPVIAEWEDETGPCPECGYEDGCDTDADGFLQHENPPPDCTA